MPAYDALTAPLSALVGAPSAPAPAAAFSAAPVSVDPLSAPLAAVLGQPLAADPAAPAATWPCIECGGRSPLEAAACTTCGTPFGGRISRLDDAKSLRQKRMFVAIGVAAAFLAMLAAFTFATTTAPERVPDEIVETLPAL